MPIIRMNMRQDIQENLDYIFGAIVIGGLDKNNPLRQMKINGFKKCISMFRSKFNINVFQDEYAFIYEIIVGNKISSFTKSQLEAAVYNNSDLVLESPYIDISKWDSTIDNRRATEEEKIEAFKLNMLDLYDVLSNKIVDYEEFSSACENYLFSYKKQLMLQTAQDMVVIMSDTGMEVKETGKRKKIYRGIEDAEKYHSKSKEILGQLSGSGGNSSYVLDKERYEKQKACGNVAREKIFNSGLTEIDDVVGKIKRGDLLSILGAAKCGKTSLSIMLGERALAAGYNVAVWMLDGTSTEWENKHTVHYIKKTTKKALEPDELDNANLDIEKKKLIDCARLNIACDEKRGRLSFIQGVAYVEDFVDVLKGHYDEDNPFDVIIVDGLIHVMSKYGMGKVQRISEAYIKFKQFIANELVVPAIGVVPAQLNTECVKSIRNDPTAEIDVTAGGESSETIKSADEVWGVFATKTERDTGKNKIYAVASRHHGNFDNFYCGCDMARCDFWSDASLNQ